MISKSKILFYSHTTIELEEKSLFCRRKVIEFEVYDNKSYFIRLLLSILENFIHKTVQFIPPIITHNTTVE